MVSKLKKHLGKDSGFTLIELMIVVAIIGILAAIAIPNFTRFQLKSKSSEGKVNLAAIRTAQEAYAAEFGLFVTAATTPPAWTPRTQKAKFENGGVADFNRLGWAPEGSVYFSYETTASAKGGAFTAAADADIDGDSNLQTWGYFSSENFTTTGKTCDHVEAGGQTLWAAVGPCDSTSGQSKF